MKSRLIIGDISSHEKFLAFTKNFHRIVNLGIKNQFVLIGREKCTYLRNKLISILIKNLLFFTFIV